MNLIKLTLLNLAVSANLFASSLVVTEDVISNTMWSKDTVFINKSDFTVQHGARLTIQPGTVVRFVQGRFITIKGTITSIGTPTDSIWFSHEISVWQGIRLLNRMQGNTGCDSSYLKYCNLSGTKGVDTDSSYMRNGSAVYCGGGNYLELGNSIVKKNEGYFGGAVYVDAGSVVHIDSCLFVGNTAGFFGGGAIMAKDNGRKELIVYNCRFEYNYARTGGAIRIGMGTKAEFNNCIFYQDTTRSVNPGLKDLKGGALAIFGPADVTLRNCLIFHCRSYGKGGGIYSSDASIKLINCTIARNASVYGGGIYFARDSAASSPLFINTIEGGNGRIPGVKLPRDSAGYGMFLDSSVTPIFRYCQIYDTVYDHKIKPYQGEFVHTRYYKTDFLFRNISSSYPDTVIESYQLLSNFAGSDPGINGGTPDTAGLGLPEFDVLGQKRIHGAAIDIGAIEYCDTLLKVESIIRQVKPQRLNKPCLHGTIYSLDGRKVGEFTGDFTFHAFHRSTVPGISRGLYLVRKNMAGGEFRFERVLVR